MTQLDAKLVERGLLCSPGTVLTYDAIIAVVDKLRFYKGQVLNKAKFHGQRKDRPTGEDRERRGGRAARE